MVKFYEQLLEIPNICAIFPGDDMGFKTATMISPKHMRQYILPWHREFAQMAHAKGLPYFLHSCGDVDMDYLSRQSPDEIRRYVRKLIEDCLPGGRFAVGAGNSVANYVPIENYFAMLDEALR